jgi:metal-sulfur cluster biosynthetic enzyme
LTNTLQLSTFQTEEANFKKSDRSSKAFQVLCKQETMSIQTGQIRRRVVRRLRKVIDPELGVNIVDLGLVYQIRVDDSKIAVEFTTTTPGCPLRRYLQQQVEKAAREMVADEESLTSYEVNMVMKPDWKVEMIKEGVEFFAVPPPPRG